MTAPRLDHPDHWQWKSRMDRLEARVTELEHKLDAAKHDTERFKFDTRSKLESQDNNLWLVVFAIMNVVIIAAAVAARR